MLLIGIAAGAAVLAALLSATLNWSFFFFLGGFLVCFCFLGLVVFAGQSGKLFRALCAASALAAGLAAASTGALWTFVWVYTLVNILLILLAFGYLCWVCGRVDLNEPQAEEDDPFYRRVMTLYIEALINLVCVKVHTQGTEKLPEDGRFLLVCNHLFLADPGILLHVFPNSQLAFVTKQENMSMFIINKFMHKILCQPLDRENDRQALKVILKCIQLIKKDTVSVGVFPEGYTSKDGKLHHFRSGVFKIAQKANVPIVVCTLQGTRDIFHNLARLKHTDVHLHLVDVIPARELWDKTTTQISDTVYEMMISDLGESFRAESQENT